MEATFVKKLKGFQGDARLYKLSEPYTVRGWDEEAKFVTSHIIVSAVIALYSGPETYIFPADADGEITDWTELSGSYRGGLDHDEALAGFLGSIPAEAQK